MRIQSEAQYAQQRAARSVSDEAKWRREAEVWFDGTVQSVDGRLAMCRRLLAGARTKAASEGISEARLDRIAHYEQSQAALEHLRRQLLTGCIDIEAAHPDPGAPCKAPGCDAPRVFSGYCKAHNPDRELGSGQPWSHTDWLRSRGMLGSLQPSDQRWVTLEAAKLARDHADVPADELAIRAANYAESCTGVLPQKRAKAITAALVAEAVSIHRSRRPIRTAAYVPQAPSCADEMMFM